MMLVVDSLGFIHFAGSTWSTSFLTFPAGADCFKTIAGIAMALLAIAGFDLAQALSLDVAGAELFLMSSCLYLQALPLSHFPF